VGNINVKSDGTCVYYIRSLDEINILINHFDKYPLITKKHTDYLLFRSAFEIIRKKQHLTEKGFNEIVALRASLNKGLPEKLKEAFPNVTPLVRSDN